MVMPGDCKVGYMSVVLGVITSVAHGITVVVIIMMCFRMRVYRK
jgi:hypothetical protein